MHGLDIRMFHWINDWSSQWSPLFVFFSEATKGWGVRIGILAVIALLIAAGPTTRKAAWMTIATVIVANSFSNGLKYMFPMQRPCVELTNYVLYVGRLDSYGTASSHAANMAGVAFVLCYYLKWWGAPWVLVALITGCARVYVGVHYPSQVLFGFLCGLLSALIVIQTWEAFVKRRANKADLNISP